MFRRFRAAGELPYGAFGELVWETQRTEMQALAERVMAERQQAQSMEIDLQCGGVNLTGWLQQVQPDGLLRWRPSLLSVSRGCNFGWNTLSTAPAAAPARAGCLCGKRESGAFRRWRPPRRRRTLTSWWMAICWGCRSRCCCCRKAVARLKACYDAEKDVILMDEETQQKARSKFLQTYEGNMVVSGEGADIWYQRLWRSLEPAHYEEIIAQTQRYLLPLYRYHRSTQI